ncbi:MAG: CYTH and CHAD domain-containing protein [Betaproteobacteria bacterium]
MKSVRPAPDPGSTPVETELKLAIDPRALPRLAKHPALKPLADGRARRGRVVSTYHDTPDRRLHRAGLTLRVRRDGRRWRMAVKGAPLADAPSGLLARPELEWAIDGPAIDTMRLATTPWRAVFAKALRKQTLAPVFTTDVERTSLPLAFPDGTRATLAIDNGTIVLPAETKRRVRTASVAEIELELGSGDARTLLDLATRLCEDLPLALEPRSKAERGYALAGGIADAPSRAREIVHADDPTAATALAAIVEECVRQVAANAPGFRARHLADPEWVHQMRIAVRRLRSCLALADGIAAASALAHLRAETRWALDALGPARDLDVFVVETLPAVLDDLDRADGESAKPVHDLARGAARRRRSASGAAVACVASTRFTRLALAASALAASLRAGGIADAGEPRGGDARRFAMRVVERRARRLDKAGAGLEHADVEARHAVRIAAKKLRYATEFFATLFPRRRTRDYRRALAKLQDALGGFNDAAVAARVAAVLAGPTAPATVAIQRWSAGRIAQGAERIDDAWSDYAKARRFWSRA